MKKTNKMSPKGLQPLTQSAKQVEGFIFQISTAC